MMGQGAEQSAGVSPAAQLKAVRQLGLKIFRIGTRMMSQIDHQEALFLHTLEKLREQVDSNEPFEILAASASIRKLIIDSNPLLHQVNRKHRLKINFSVGQSDRLPPGFPKPVVWSLQDGIDPDTSPPGVDSMTLTLDQFLSLPVLRVQDKEFTVKDIVKFEANTMGGVHSGSPREEKEQVLAILDNRFSIGGHRASLRQLKAIGRVVIKGLSEIEDAVIRSQKAD